MKRVLVLFLAVFALSAFKSIDIKDGQVPDQYLASAKKLEGVYAGTFERWSGELTIVLEGNKPVLQYKDSRGASLLPASCAATIGNMQWAQASNDGQIVAAGFKFNPANCSNDVRGREIALSINNSKSIKLSIFEGYTWERQCRPDAPPPWGPGTVCETIRKETFLNGRFSR